MRRWLRRFAVLCGGLILVLALAFAAVQTNVGKGWVARFASTSLSAPGMIVTVGALEGVLPFNARVRDVAVADDAGTWLTVDRIDLRWSPLALLRGRVAVEAIEVGQVDVRRLPESDSTKPPSSGGSFALPKGLPEIALARLAVERIDLAEDVLGEAVTLRLDATAALARRQADATISLRRTDGAGHLEMTLAFVPEANRLDARLDAAEPTGRLADRLLDRDDRLPLQLTLDGAGPLDDWQGRLLGGFGEEVKIDLALVVRGSGARRIAATGTIRPGPLVPDDWQETIGDEIRLRAEATVGEAAISVDTLDVTTAGIALTGSGRRGTDGAIAGTVDATIVDLAPIGRALELPLGGASQAHVVISGTETAPTAVIDLTARDVASGTFAAANTTVRATVTRDGAATKIVAEGRIASPRAGPDLPDVGDIDWSLAGTVTDDGGVRLERLRATGAAISIEAGGTAEPAGVVDLRLDLRADRTLLTPLAPTFVGTATVSGTVRGNAGSGIVEANFSGAITEPAGDAALVALIGDRLQWSLRAARAADGTLRVTDLSAEGRNVSLTGGATIAADGSEIDGSAHLRLPRLDVLAQPLGTPMAGAVTIQVDLRGDPMQPAGTVRIESPDLTVSGRRLRRLDARIELPAESEHPTAAVTVRAETDGVPATLSATVQQRDLRTISIDDIRAAVGDARATGRLTLVDFLPAEGRLSIDAQEVAGLAPLLGTKITGGGKVDLRLERGPKQQKLTAAVRVTRLATAGITTGGVTLDATIDDPLGTPGGTISLDARVITAAGHTVDRLRIDGRGSLAQGVRMTLSASARRPKPVEAALTARIERAGNAFRTTVTPAEVTIDGRRIALGGPLQIGWDRVATTVEGLDLRLEEGRITGRGRLSPDGAAAELTIARLPLATVGRLAGMPRLVGRLDGQIAVDTGGQSPNGRVALDATGLRWRGAGRDLPAISIRTEGRWADGRVRVTSALRDTPDATLSVTATVPLVRRSAPFDFVMPGDGAVQARAEGNADLTRLQRYLPIEGFAMAGRIEIALSLDGTVADPRPGGRARLVGVRIEDGSSGVVLAGTEATIVGDGGRFRIESLTATDGSGGRLSATGEAARGGAGWRGEGTLSIERFRVLANDLGTARASGRLTIRGSADGIRVAGETRIDNGEIQVPAKPPASIVTIPVVEVNRPGGTPIVEPPPGDPAIPIALAITVAVPGRLFVRGRGIETEWRGELQVAGTIDQPLVTGRIQTVRGHYDLIGRRFTVERGIIRFDGNPTAAVLDVLAAANANEVRATVTVGGSVTSPNLTLGSDPALPQDEVLSRVLFGKGTGQITPGQAVALAQAAAELAGFGGGSGILDRVRKRLGLDTLDVGGSNGTSVTLGRYIADDIFVKVNPNPGQNGSTVEVEIQVAPNITVDTGVGTDGTKVGVKYRLDY